MKSSIVSIVFAVLGTCAVLRAQGTMNSILQLDNGARVLYQTYSQPDPGATDPSKAYGAVRALGNAIERTMTDGTNRTWLGFRLRIERLPGDPIRFRLSMEPLDRSWGFFGQTAAPREIQNGDRVLLDVLQEPGTGRKIYDTFQVGVGVDMQFMPYAGLKAIPQVPASSAVIHLSNPEFLSGGAKLGKSSSAVQGATVAVVVPGKGRFTFATKASPGFRMEAIAQGGVVSFVSGKDTYDIQSSAAILDSPGTWYLWVRQETSPAQPSPVPTLELAAGQPAFESLSITPGTGSFGCQGGPGTSDPRSLRCQSVNANVLLSMAYGDPAIRIIVDPTWVNAYFDLSAKLPDGTTKEQLAIMMQNLLQERFKAVVHTETRVRDKYDLVVAKNGPKLQVASGRGVAAFQQDRGSTRTEFLPNLSMQELAMQLEVRLGVPVTDATGLKGRYDIGLHYVSEKSRVANGPSGGPRLREAVEEQLGLRLEPRTGPVEYLVVDHIEKTLTQNR